LSSALLQTHRRHLWPPSARVLDYSFLSARVISTLARTPVIPDCGNLLCFIAITSQTSPECFRPCNSGQPFVTVRNEQVFVVAAGSRADHTDRGKRVILLRILSSSTAVPSRIGRPLRISGYSQSTAMIGVGPRGTQ